MKRRTLGRVAVAIAVALVGVGIGASTTPASAAAVCARGHICFYQNPWYRGSMSDQTNTLIFGSGKIGDFRNKRYFNGANLNDSISSVVNNTSQCIALYSDIDFQSNIPAFKRLFGTGSPNVYLVIGPKTSVVFDHVLDKTILRDIFNDRFSAAAVNSRSTHPDVCNKIGHHNWAPVYL